MNRPFNYYRDLPPDVWPRRITVGPEPVRGMPASEGDRSQPLPYLGNAILVGKAFQGRSVTVGTTATQIIDSPSAWPYLIVNPTMSTGLTSSGTVFAGAVAAAGTSQLTPIGVANYLYMHLFLQVTAVGGGATWDIYAQTRDPITGVWCDSQIVFNNIVAPVNAYASIGMFGVPTDFAIRWDPVVAGTMTFQVDYTLKEGLGGTAAGFANTVYLGPNNGVSSVSGYPLLEGIQQAFILDENVELWGIASANVDIRIFEM